ncbi:MAG: hypothetical protein ERJ68_06340, partial [Aphanocapsa feldmannii 277cI]
MAHHEALPTESGLARPGRGAGTTSPLEPLNGGRGEQDSAAMPAAWEGAIAQYRAGAYEEVCSLTDRLLLGSPDSIYLRLLQAHARLGLGQCAEAARHYRRVLQDLPTERPPGQGCGTAARIPLPQRNRQQWLRGPLPLPLIRGTRLQTTAHRAVAHPGNNPTNRGNAPWGQWPQRERRWALSLAMAPATRPPGATPPRSSGPGPGAADKAGASQPEPQSGKTADGDDVGDVELNALLDALAAVPEGGPGGDGASGQEGKASGRSDMASRPMRDLARAAEPQQQQDRENEELHRGLILLRWHADSRPAGSGAAGEPSGQPCAPESDETLGRELNGMSHGGEQCHGPGQPDPESVARHHIQGLAMGRNNRDDCDNSDGSATALPSPGGK